jgi:hypothetical protein
VSVGKVKREKKYKRRKGSSTIQFNEKKSVCKSKSLESIDDKSSPKVRRQASAKSNRVEVESSLTESIESNASFPFEIQSSL